MIRPLTAVVGLALVCVTMGLLMGTAHLQREDPSDLVIVWTSGDEEVAERMVLMYAHAARTNKWFSSVKLVVWGPSQKLLAESAALQQKVRKMQEDGVKVQACVVCAGSCGLVDRLKELRIEVKSMGQPLSEQLKDDNVSVLAF